jgi:AcrR family transcriptional regulator
MVNHIKVRQQPLSVAPNVRSTLSVAYRGGGCQPAFRMSRITAQPRHTATERREAILEAAITEFAIGGLHGASTDEIARRAAISQPYVFRLYGTKMDLFLAVIERVFRRTLEVFQLAAGRAAAGEAELFSVLRSAYGDLVTSDRRLLLATL